GRGGDEELVDRDRHARRLTAGPRRAGGVALRRGSEDVELPRVVLVEVRRLARDRAGRKRRVRSAARRGRREALGGCALDAREDLVPDAVGPAVEAAVPDQPLLLRAVDDGAAVK